MEQLSKMMNTVNKAMNTSTLVEDPNNDLNLPLKTIDDFDNFEKSILADVEMRKLVVSTFNLNYNLELV